MGSSLERKFWKLGPNQGEDSSLSVALKSLEALQKPSWLSAPWGSEGRRGKKARKKKNKEKKEGNRCRSSLKTRVCGPLELGGPSGIGMVKWTLGV